MNRTQGYLSRAAAWHSLCLVFLLGVVPLALAGNAAAQDVQQVIGHVEGSDFAVDGPTGSANIQISNIAGAQPLASGSHIVVRSGQARVSLEGGGEIAICGAARLQLLSSGGALTVVLEYGALDLRLNGTRTISIYTPLIVATPVVIGGEDTDTSVGLSPDGKMCLYALNGALRISQQLSGQEILIPQNGHASLSGGQVESLAAPVEACACKLDLAKLHPARSKRFYQSLGTLAPPSASPVSATSTPQPSSSTPTSTGASSNAASGQLPQPISPAPSRPAAVDEPVYKVLMPPLSFDPNAPVNISEPSADQIVLIRSVHVQDETVYQDVVEPKKKRGKQDLSAEEKSDSQSAPHGFFGKIGRFFHRVFNSSST
ncbi:MAG TPA: hypothetical protein VN862_11020 [Candidatus Acidoferrales bacterium]|nr:hypothetical protein [Candidatus Acidoferrales bacterium]